MRHARNTLTLCAALGILVLSGCDSDKPATVTDTPTRDDSPTSLANHRGPIEPGEYAVPLWGDDWEAWPRAVVDIPAGFDTGGGWVVTDASEGGWLTFQYADLVVSDPCAGNASAARVGPTASDLTTALISQPDLHTSEPQPATIGGHDGFYFQLRVPRDVDLTKCDHKQQALWRFGNGGYFGLEKRHTVHLWILDVDGRRIIMIASIPADQTSTQKAEILDMARGVQFIEPTDL